MHQKYRRRPQLTQVVLSVQVLLKAWLGLCCAAIVLPVVAHPAVAQDVAQVATQDTATAPAKSTKINASQYVFAQTGDLPIILSAPHGGNGEVPDIKPRSGEGLETGPAGFFTGRDTGTEELVREVSKAIQRRFGKSPYVVASKFHRKFLDPNRPAAIAYEDPRIQPIYDHYHGTVASYCRIVAERFHSGVLLDIHGQKSRSDTVFRGTKNGLTVQRLRDTYGKAAHDGPQSLFGLLQARGWTVFPAVLSEAEQSGFTGGFIVQTYGSHKASPIDAMQLEFGADFRTKNSRSKTAEVLADALAEYAKAYLRIAVPDADKSQTPRHRTIDLNVGDTVEVELVDKTIAKVKLLDVQETRDSVRKAIREARVKVEINGFAATLDSANYRLPITVGEVQVDCPATRGLNESVDARDDPWGLRKDVRLRLWPAGSTWLPPDQFVYPLRQRWFASATQIANEPSFVDGGDAPLKRRIYYHYGLDIGGAEGLTEVIAATDGVVVSSGLDKATDVTSPPVAERADVVYVRDARNWFYRYSHLKTIDVHLGDKVTKGQKIGTVGKEGATAWSHLHFDIKAMQPSGKWGIEEGYAFLWEAYQQQFKPNIIAVARPHHLIYAGEKVTLDGSRSWSASGKIDRFEWTLSDGAQSKQTQSNQSQIERQYDKPGQYSEVLKVVDANGNSSYDFATVLVIDRKLVDQYSPTLHASYWPTFEIRPGDPVTFKVRSFFCEPLGETWDFGDGSPLVTVRSDGNAQPHAPNGYAEVEHRFAKSGDYIVSVKHPGRDGHEMTARLHVRVQAPNPADKAHVIDLWPGAPPDEPGTIGAEFVRRSPALGRDKVEVNTSTRMVTNVTNPTLSIYRPAPELDTGTSMLICPGGGYWDLYWELEGEEVAKWLTSHGITGIVLKYRVPRRPDEDKTQPARRPLQDAQRAVSLVRSRAKEWDLNPDRIGMIGFSAGGHLAIATATHFDDRTYAAIDEVDQVSPRPNFAIAAYSGYLKAKDKFELSSDLNVTDKTPPVFLVHGSQDPISPPSHSLVLYHALQQAGVPVELHLYASTTHDFGIRSAPRPYANWTEACLRWLEDQGLASQLHWPKGMER